MQTLQRYMVLVRGAGDLATGVIARLHRAGFRVLATETAQPTVIRRAACFARAVYEGDATVDGLQARLASIDEAPGLMALGLIPVVVDPEGLAIVRLRPQVVVDAIVAKREPGHPHHRRAAGDRPGTRLHRRRRRPRRHRDQSRTRPGSRPLERRRRARHRTFPARSPAMASDRVLRSPAAGVFHACAAIGDTVSAGQSVAEVNGHPVVAQLAGILRGLLQDGLTVPAGLKVGDVDPRATRANCFTISDKAHAIAGGVLEAVLARLDTVPRPGRAPGRPRQIQ